MLQDLDDLMQWLSDFGVRSAAFDRLRETLQGEQSASERSSARWRQLSRMSPPCARNCT